MKRLLTLLTAAATLLSGASMAVTPTGADFNDTGDILARSTQHPDIECQIMVQRATCDAGSDLLYACGSPGGLYQSHKASRG